MDKTTQPGQSILLFIIVWLIIFQSVSESSYRIPQFSQQVSGPEKGFWITVSLIFGESIPRLLIRRGVH